MLKVKPEEGETTGHGTEYVVGGRAEDGTLLAGVLIPRANPTQERGFFLHLKKKFKTYYLFTIESVTDLD